MREFSKEVKNKIPVPYVVREFSFDLFIDPIKQKVRQFARKDKKTLVREIV